MATSKHGEQFRDERLPDKSVLQLRRTEAGLRVVGDAPERHVFTPSFVERELENGAELLLKLPTREGDPDLVYRLVGFERGEDGSPNLTSWICDKVEG